MKFPKKWGKNLKSYFRIFLVFIVLFITIGTVSLMYYQRLYDTIRQENRSYLQEVSRRIVSNIDRIINDNFAVLHTMSSVAEQLTDDSLDNLSAIMQKYKEQWNYQRVMFIDKQGYSFDLNGNEMFFTLDENVRKKIISGNESMSTAQVINNHEYILFSVPVRSIEVGGKTIVALAATYDPLFFDQSLSMSSFSKQAYSQIITKNGAAVTVPSTDYAFDTGYNVLSTVGKSDIDSQSSIGKMHEDILYNQSGLIGFTIDGVYRYMVYTPMAADDWYLLTFVPVQVVNEKSEMLLKTTLLLCGLVGIAFAALSVAILYISNKNKRHLEQIAYVDDVTSGNTIQKFYLLTDLIMEKNPEKQYALVFTNINKFKVLNEQLGRPLCDSMLKAFYDFITPLLLESECMGRLSADNFCILLEFEAEDKLVERFKYWRKEMDVSLANKISWGLPTVTFGVYVIVDRAILIQQMIDRAKLSTKGTLWSVDNKLAYSFYDDDMRHKMFREKYLEDKMEPALANREFQVFLQPKYNLAANTIGGAEALIRWVNPAEGMIYPDEFIPLFEKNGFVVQTDLWVFEEVCKTISSWNEKGLPRINISVNCSRVHFKHPNFLEPYINICEQYNIDKSQIEIEITESVVFENSDMLIRIIDQIKDYGFGCSMDDFGSGYSSLNLIQTIPVDTLKLDKSFFMKNVAGVSRIEAVVKNMVGLAKALSMKTVAEGVEYPEQVNMLRRIGCDYIQGYVYAKPMNIEAFEDFAFNKNPTLAKLKE